MTHDAFHAARRMFEGKTSVLIVVDGEFDKEQIGRALFAFLKNVRLKSKRADVGTRRGNTRGDEIELRLREGLLQILADHWTIAVHLSNRPA